MESLQSYSNRLSDPGWQAFRRPWPSLRSLFIDPPSTPEAARCLHGLAPQLEDLTLRGAISDAAMAALLEVRWDRLHTLRLGPSAVTNASAPILADRQALPALEKIVLICDGLRGEGVRTLRKAYGYGLKRRQY